MHIQRCHPDLGGFLMGCDVCFKPSVDSEAGSLRTEGEQRPLEVICVCCAVLSPWHLTL